MSVFLLGVAVVRPGPPPAQAEAGPAAPRWRHLHTPAGQLSVPPSAAHRAAQGLGPAAAAGDPRDACPPVASVPAHALALQATQALARAVGEACCAQVGHLLHSHATYDEQPLSSTPLRLAQASFPHAGDAFSIGQLGCAGLAAALHLAGLHPAEATGLSVLSAADRWLPPFDRHFGTLATLGDGAAALLVAPAQHATLPPAWAQVCGTATRLVAQPRGGSLWDQTPEALADALVAALQAAAQAALAQAGWEAADLDLLAGDDTLGQQVPQRLRQGLGCQPHVTVPPATVHLSSSALAETLQRAALAAQAPGAKPLRGLLWTAAPGGAVAAVALRFQRCALHWHGDVLLAAPPASP
jgi:hypothetical protein